jgi:hypothetical protein
MEEVISQRETMEVISSFRTLMNEHYVKTNRVDLPDLVDRFEVVKQK